MAKSWIDSLFKASDARKAVENHRKDYEKVLPYLEKIQNAARAGHNVLFLQKQNTVEAFFICELLITLGYYAKHEPRTGDTYISWEEQK